MVGQKIKELRQQKGWSQEELGQKIQYTKSNVSKWENETTSPDIETLKKLADLFGVDINYFLGIETPKQVQQVQQIIYLPQKHIIEPEDQRRLNKKLNFQLAYAIAQFACMVLMVIGIVYAGLYRDKYMDYGFSYSTITVEDKHHYEFMSDFFMYFGIFFALAFVALFIIGIVNAVHIQRITKGSTVLVVFAAIPLYFAHIIVAGIQFHKYKRK